jgi:deoxyadenosine/deoxycytidine kinase
MPQSAILDRSIYEDAYIFSRALHHLGNLSERDYLAYRRVFDLLVSKLPPPDLLIYLRAPVSVLMERIHRRGRSIETGITADYLSLLESFYDEWMQHFDVCPVLTIRTDDLDFVNKTQHLNLVVERIQDKLAGREEVIFPSEAGS